MNDGAWSLPGDVRAALPSRIDPGALEVLLRRLPETARVPVAHFIIQVAEGAPRRSAAAAELSVNGIKRRLEVVVESNAADSLTFGDPELDRYLRDVFTGGTPP